MKQVISIELAERFARKIAKYTEYNVNIINEKGIIIAASRDTERIGTFHEAAFHMLKNHLESLVIRSDGDLSGTRMGVNLLIQSGGCEYGVIGLSGDPDKVGDIALIIKMSFEAVIGYERQQVEALSRQSSQEQLFNALFLEVPPVSARLDMLARQLNIESDCIRVAVLFHTNQPEYDSRKAVSIGRSRLSSLKEQDFCCNMDNEHLLVFLSIPGSDSLSRAMNRDELLERVDQIREAINADKVYIGSEQDRLRFYVKAYEHCRWLEEYSTDLPESTFFFYDHLEAYFASLVPNIEFLSVFHLFERRYGDFFTENYKSTIAMLEKTNYNLAESSRKMYLHKNTLAFRIGKLKEVTGLDIMHSTIDRVFLHWFLYYMEKKR